MISCISLVDMVENEKAVVIVIIGFSLFDFSDIDLFDDLEKSIESVIIFYIVIVFSNNGVEMKECNGIVWMDNSQWLQSRQFIKHQIDELMNVLDQY